MKDEKTWKREQLLAGNTTELENMTCVNADNPVSLVSPLSIKL